MPDKPRSITVMPHARSAQRMPWTKRKDAPKRLSGRRLQARNDRIRARDGFICQNIQCGHPTVRGHVDHKKALAYGGSDDDENLQLLCKRCNMAKASAESRGISLDNPSDFDPEAVLHQRLTG